MRNEPPYVINLLREMEEYLASKWFFVCGSKQISYCGKCKSIVPIVGSYEKPLGSNCKESHTEYVLKPDRCLNCKKGYSFIKIFSEDIANAKIPGKEMSDVLLPAIEKTLLKMESEYDSNLFPSVKEKWKKFSEEEKLGQIEDMIELQRQLSLYKNKVRKLENLLN
jgi:thiol-disulfide isomerase/thioredoxin